MKIHAKSLKELKIFAGKFGKTLKGGEIIALQGELGAGKTTFTKFLLKSKGIRKKITSPTFVLMIPYEKSGKKFFHMDLYRTGSFKEVQALGVEDLWGKKDNIFIIEWADKIKKYLPAKTILIKFNIKNSGREISIQKRKAQAKQKKK